MSGTATGAGALIRLGRALAATALCAQLAHVVIYGSFFPAGGAHHYLTWYVPLVFALSVAALALVPVSIATRVITNGRISQSALLPERHPGGAFVDVSRLALSAGAFLLVQETIERSAVAGGPHVATFSPFTLLVAVVALVVAAATVVAIERTLDGLGERELERRRSRAVQSETWSAKAACLVRRRPQSRHGGLRAPPLTA